MAKIEKTEQQWQAELDAEQYKVLRLKGTEAPFSGEYDHVFEPGTYHCAGCGAELFVSETKYDSGCGWPAFYAPASDDAIDEETDAHLRDGAHRGHVRELWRPPRPRLPGRPAPRRGSATASTLRRCASRRSEPTPSRGGAHAMRAPPARGGCPRRRARRRPLAADRVTRRAGCCAQLGCAIGVQAASELGMWHHLDQSPQR